MINGLKGSKKDVIVAKDQLLEVEVQVERTKYFYD